MSEPLDVFAVEGEMAPGEDKMERLQKLVDEIEDVKSDVDYHAEELAKAEERIKTITRTEIPEIMAEIGMTAVKTESGLLVEVNPKVNCTIKNENKPKAFDWLRENDFGGLIKSKLAVEFGKGEENEAQEALHALEDLGLTCGLEDSIHPATLKSWAQERLEAGDTIPDPFSVFEYKEAKISSPKAKKAAKVKK